MRISYSSKSKVVTIKSSQDTVTGIFKDYLKSVLSVRISNDFIEYDNDVEYKIIFERISPLEYINIKRVYSDCKSCYKNRNVYEYAFSIPEINFKTQIYSDYINCYYIAEKIAHRYHRTVKYWRFYGDCVLEYHYEDAEYTEVDVTEDNETEETIAEPTKIKPEPEQSEDVEPVSEISTGESKEDTTPAEEHEQSDDVLETAPVEQNVIISIGGHGATLSQCFKQIYENIDYICEQLDRAGTASADQQKQSETVPETAPAEEPEQSYNENERFANVVFADNEHKQMFFGVLGRMDLEQDRWRESLAYLITLDTVCRQHIADMYDFDERCIKPDCLDSPWQTSSSLRTTLFAFNLFTGHLCWCPDDFKNRCTPSEIFNYFEYSEYYWQAIKIRYALIG